MEASCRNYLGDRDNTRRRVTHFRDFRNGFTRKQTPATFTKQPVAEMDD